MDQGQSSVIMERTFVGRHYRYLVALFVVTLTTGITYNSINAFINHAAVFVCTERIDQVISNYERKWWLVG